VVRKEELHFDRDMINGRAVLKNEISYNPKRFNPMVAEYGGVKSAHRPPAPGAANCGGFTQLYGLRRLDMSVEAHALLP